MEEMPSRITGKIREVNSNRGDCSSKINTFLTIPSVVEHTCTTRFRVDCFTQIDTPSSVSVLGSASDWSPGFYWRPPIYPCK